MLQVPELKRAMGFVESFCIEQGTRRDRIRLLGNAVCPPVMQAVVHSLTRTETTLISARCGRKRVEMNSILATEPRQPLYF